MIAFPSRCMQRRNLLSYQLPAVLPAAVITLFMNKSRLSAIQIRDKVPISLATENVGLVCQLLALARPLACTILPHLRCLPHLK